MGSKAARGPTRKDRKLQEAGEKLPALGRLGRCLGHEIVRQPRAIRQAQTHRRQKAQTFLESTKRLRWENCSLFPYALQK